MNGGEGESCQREGDKNKKRLRAFAVEQNDSKANATTHKITGNVCIDKVYDFLENFETG